MPAPMPRAEPVRAADPVRAPEAHPVHVGAATAMAAMAEHDQLLHRTAETRMEPRATPGRNEALAMEPEDRPFIAPRPVEAPLRPEPAAVRSEPMRAPLHTEPLEADDEPGPAPRARGNIFRRVTGGAAGLMRAGVDLLDRQAEAPAQPQRGKQAPRLARERSAPVVEEPAAQPRLSGLDPADRLGGDEDLLDIPAFLRRQAN
jgi:cell division protein FtsZ